MVNVCKRSSPVTGFVVLLIVLADISAAVVGFSVQLDDCHRTDCDLILLSSITLLSAACIVWTLQQTWTDGWCFLHTLFVWIVFGCSAAPFVYGLASASFQDRADIPKWHIVLHGITLVILTAGLVVGYVLRLLGSPCMHPPPVAVTQAKETSESHPFHVDFLPLSKWPGVIGMGILPGRQKGRCVRSVADDVNRLAQVHKINVICSVVEDGEIVNSDLCSAVPAAGIELLRLPVRDKWVPASMQSFHAFVHTIAQRLVKGDRVFVHCNGGKGRTGLTVCSTLLLLGEASGVVDSIRKCRQARPGTIYNPLQILYLTEYNAQHVDGQKIEFSAAIDQLSPA